MTWIFAAVGLATAGLALLGVLAVRAFAAARVLSEEIGRTSRRIGPAWGELRAEVSTIRHIDG